MTSRARHEKSTAGLTLLQMLNQELDEVNADRAVPMDEYNVGIMDGYAGGLAFSIATIIDPYRTKDRHELIREIIQESEDRIVVSDDGGQ